MNAPIDRSRINALLAKVRNQNAAAQSQVTKEQQEEAKVFTPTQVQESLQKVLGVSTSRAPVEYNAKQSEFISLASSGKSCILIGAAGTGKTTSMKGVVISLIQSGIAGTLSSDGHKHLVDGTPGIIACAFTRRATANIRKQMPEDMKSNCITIHKLLEYQPQYYEVIDEATGDAKTIMVFEPNRNASNPLPSSIKTIIFEESSMIGTDLFGKLLDAIQHQVQFIFLGDIQQLPPIFGPAILGFKMLELPVVELTEVYRQALESPIIRLAHQILSGKPIAANKIPEWKIDGKLTIHPWKKKISSEEALLTAAYFFKNSYDHGTYDPFEDMILMPFNKAFGTIELNKHIANHIARKKGLVTYEVIAGFNKHYLSIGDKVLVDKEDAIIIDIAHNGLYAGKAAAKPSTTLDYWGCEHSPGTVTTTQEEIEQSLDDIDLMLSSIQVSGDGDKSERVTKCSHLITVRMCETDEERVLETAAEVNSLLLAYALTIHKSQGSEWRKVFVLLHKSHATMLQRELLYTAVTRAREELYVICEPDSFVQGVLSQKIRGNTLEEKAEFFKGKQKELEV